MPTIHETCSCGATLDYTSGSSTDIGEKQSAFHTQHTQCHSQTEGDDDA